MNRHLALLSFFFGFSSLPVSAILDANGNGLSDLWEAQYKVGEHLTANLDPEVDDDADGWTNALEAIAGTDPFDPTPPYGLLSQAISHVHPVYNYPVVADPEPIEDPDPLNYIPPPVDPNLPAPELVTQGSVSISWPTIPGKRYTLLYSLDQCDGPWSVFEEPFIGDGSIELFSFELSVSVIKFWRVKVEDVDTDGGGLTNAEEASLGTSPWLRDTDGDGVSDYNDPAPLTRIPYHADADADGIPDSEDAEPNISRGLPPSVVSQTPFSSAVVNVQKGETLTFLLTVNNPSGPVATASDLKLYAGGPESPAVFIPAGPNQFMLYWVATLPPDYPVTLMRCLAVRFKDAANATAWIELGRFDIAEWEGMIAGLRSGSPTTGWQLNIRTHRNGIRSEALPLVNMNGGQSCWYRGAKAISLFETDPLVTAASVTIGEGVRYPLFQISGTNGGPFIVQPATDISNPITYPHHGNWYASNHSTQVRIAVQPNDVILQPGETKFQPMPEALLGGQNFTYVEGFYLKSGQESSLFSSNWPLYPAHVAYRLMSGLNFFSAPTPGDPTRASFDATDLFLPISCQIVPFTAGSLARPGLPDNSGSPSPLLPMASGQWHKIVIKAGPDSGAVSSGIRLKLNSGLTGTDAPQTGFELQRETSQGMVPMAFGTDGIIDIAAGSAIYQQLTSPDGLALFAMRGKTVNLKHILALCLLPNASTGAPLEIKSLGLLPIDLDVNNDGDIEDSCDGLASYMPGYELDNAKLHTGGSFANAKYVGPQQIKLMIVGIGTTAVDSATFRIFNPTRWFGYCGNAISKGTTPAEVATDVALNWGADFSFYPTTESTYEYNGTIEANKIWAPVFCKDYGGWCEVEITLKKNGVEVLAPFRLTLPRDENHDQLADLWQDNENSDWNTQFNPAIPRPTTPDGRALVNPDLDDEEADSDGAGPYPAMADEGDGLKICVEYRGFIFDGGPATTHGMHKRLSAARKELLVECSEMEGIASVGGTITPPPPIPPNPPIVFTDQGNGANPTAQGYTTSSTMQTVNGFYAAHGAPTATPPHFPGVIMDLYWVRDKLNDMATNVVYTSGAMRSAYKYSGPYGGPQSGQQRNGWLSIASDLALFNANRPRFDELYGGGQGVAILATSDNRNDQCRQFVKLAIQGRRGVYLANGDARADTQKFAVEVDEAYESDYKRQGAALFVNSISEESSALVFPDRIAWSFAHELGHLFILGRNTNGSIAPFEGGEHISSGINNLMNGPPASYSNCRFHESEITHTNLRQRASVNKTNNGLP